MKASVELGKGNRRRKGHAKKPMEAWEYVRYDACRYHEHPGKREGYSYLGEGKLRVRRAVCCTGDGYNHIQDIKKGDVAKACLHIGWRRAIQDTLNFRLPVFKCAMQRCAVKW